MRALFSAVRPYLTPRGSRILCGWFGVFRFVEGSGIGGVAAWQRVKLPDPQ